MVKKDHKKHPSRLIFQALRIEVNHELEALERVLSGSMAILNKN
jgi:16S rRNA C1402 N4-methylase RsmH